MVPQKTTPLPPESIETWCPTCRQERDHLVLKGKVVLGGRGVEGTFTCQVCSTVHPELVHVPTPIEVPFIVSQEAESEPAAVQMFEDDVVAVGDEFEIEDSLIEVTAVELKDEGRRVQHAKAQDIQSLWGKNIDFIRVGFAMNIGPRTMSFESDFGPEDEIAVGEEFDYQGDDLIVERLITHEGKRFYGSFNVRDIKRVWLRRKKDERPKSRPDPNVPRGQKAQRQASRERAPGGPRPPGRAPYMGRAGEAGGPRRGGPPGTGPRPRQGGGPARSDDRRSGPPGRPGPWARSGDDRRSGPPRGGPRSDDRRSGPPRGGPKQGGDRRSGPPRGGPKGRGPGARSGGDRRGNDRRGPSRDRRDRR